MTTTTDHAPIVFFGDSITDCQHRTDPEGLGAGYVRLLAEGHLSDRTVINSGISGNRVVDLQARLDDDVLAHGPGVVSILIGINDTWRRFDSGSPTATEEFASGYLDVLHRIRAGAPDARIVVMEPFLLPVTEQQRTEWRDDLDPKIAVSRSLAEQFGATLVPTDTALTARAVEAGNDALAGDGVHPTAAGHAAIAALWAETVG